MTSLQAFDGGHPGLAVEECQLTEGTTGPKSGYVDKTGVDYVHGTYKITFRLKLEGVVHDRLDPER